MLREVDYKDAQGKLWRRAIPVNAPDIDAPMGVLIGPMAELSSLGLPPEIEVKLHNELFHRGILTVADARSKKADIASAVQATYRASASHIARLFEAVDQPAPEDVI